MRPVAIRKRTTLKARLNVLKTTLTITALLSLRQQHLPSFLKSRFNQASPSHRFNSHANSRAVPHPYEPSEQIDFLISPIRFYGLTSA
jgi:hypothetical protein